MVEIFLQNNGLTLQVFCIEKNLSVVMIDMRENKSLKKHHLNLTFWYKITDNLLLSPPKIDLAAGYLTFFADYMLLSAKKNRLSSR